VKRDNGSLRGGGENTKLMICGVKRVTHAQSSHEKSLEIRGVGNRNGRYPGKESIKLTCRPQSISVSRPVALTGT
jgi:hypothetical protein